MNELEKDIEAFQDRINRIDSRITALQEQQRTTSEAIRSEKKERERLEKMIAKARMKLVNAK